MKEYDIIVIGAGPGGIATAKKSAKLGATVALIEKDRVGGTCLHGGCIPTKALARKAKMFKDALNLFKFNRQRDVNFWKQQIMSPDWLAILEDGKKIIALNQKGLENSIKISGIEVFYGEAEVLPARRVKVVGDEEWILNYTKGVIVATGSSPKRFEQFKDFEGDVVLYSDDVFNIEKFKELPRKLLIIGGGVIGCEFASIFNNLGVEVTIIEALPQILSGIIDSEFCTRTILREFKKKKINIVTGATLKEIKKGEEKVVAVLSNKMEIETEKVLIVAGRVKNDKIVQKWGKESPDVCFVGDVLGNYGLAYTAEHEGEVAAYNIFTGISGRLNKDDLVPMIIFSDPEIALVGFKEEQYTSRPYKVGRYMYRALGKAHCDGEICGEIKMIVSLEEPKEVVGIQICGASATEVIQTAYVLMHNKVPYNKWTQMLWLHPTYVEIFKKALDEIE